MTQDDVRALIRGLERSTWPLARWNHEAHLAMAVWYLTYLPRNQALRVIRKRVVAQNEATDTAGRYHETVTMFLACGVGAYLDALPDQRGFDDRLELTLAAFGDYRSLVRQYYRAPTIESSTARARWVEPDRRPMCEWLRACADLAAAIDAETLYANAG